YYVRGKLTAFGGRFRPQRESLDQKRSSSSYPMDGSSTTRFGRKRKSVVVVSCPTIQREKERLPSAAFEAFSTLNPTGNRTFSNSQASSNRPNRWEARS